MQSAMVFLWHRSLRRPLVLRIDGNNYLHIYNSISAKMFE